MNYSIVSYILFSVPEQMLMMAIFWTLIGRNKTIFKEDCKLYLVSTFGFCLIYFITTNLQGVHFMVMTFIPMIMNMLMMVMIGFYYESEYIRSEKDSKIRNIYNIIKIKSKYFRKFFHYAGFIYFVTVSAQYPLKFFVDDSKWGSITNWTLLQKIQFHFTIHYGILTFVLICILIWKNKFSNKK